MPGPHDFHAAHLESLKAYVAATEATVAGENAQIAALQAAIKAKLPPDYAAAKQELQMLSAVRYPVARPTPTPKPAPTPPKA